VSELPVWEGQGRRYGRRWTAALANGVDLPGTHSVPRVVYHRAKTGRFAGPNPTLGEASPAESIDGASRFSVLLLPLPPEAVMPGRRLSPRDDLETGSRPLIDGFPVTVFRMRVLDVESARSANARVPCN
jgi:hypothetical protein